MLYTMSGTMYNMLKIIKPRLTFVLSQLQSLMNRIENHKKKSIFNEDFFLF